MTDIIRKAGFTKFQIINSDVTDEYAEKWGYGKVMKDYIQSGLLIGRKKLFWLMFKKTLAIYFDMYRQNKVKYKQISMK